MFHYRARARSVAAADSLAEPFHVSGAAHRVPYRRAFGALKRILYRGIEGGICALLAALAADTAALAILSTHARAPAVSEVEARMKETSRQRRA